MSKSCPQESIGLLPPIDSKQMPVTPGQSGYVYGALDVRNCHRDQKVASSPRSSRVLRLHKSTDGPPHVSMTPRAPTVAPTSRKPVASSDQFRIHRPAPVGAPVQQEVPPNKVAIDLQLCVKHRPGVQDVAAVWVVWVMWKYRTKDDAEYDYRQRDFLALHPAGSNVDDYVSSLYMLGSETGKVWFVAPPEGGDFVISAVRDQKLVLQAMQKKERKEGGSEPRSSSYAKHVNMEVTEDLAILADATFTTERYDMHASPLLKFIPGSTAVTEAKIDAHAAAATSSDGDNNGTKRRPDDGTSTSRVYLEDSCKA